MKSKKVPGDAAPPPSPQADSTDTDTSPNPISEFIATNVRRFREAQGLSQQQIARIAGIPRPTWANLETGEANPTVLVLTKVAAALNIGVERLLAPPNSGAEHFEAKALPTRWQGRASATQLAVHPIVGLLFERVQLPPGTEFSGGGRPPNSQEIISCEQGELEVRTEHAQFSLKTGDVLVCRADQAHTYRTHRNKAVAYILVTTPSVR